VVAVIILVELWMIEIMAGDCRETLKTLPDQSINTCITSPPYWGLRDYGEDEQLGMEDTPEEYVANLVQVFGEVKRVLRDDGTVWLNLGDSYSSGGRTTTTNQSLRGDKDYGVTRPKPSKGIKPKDLVGIPWRVAFALQQDGWYLRQDIIWHKPNPMPESVTDRCTKAHEYIFLLSKNAKYYYDHEAIREDCEGIDERQWADEYEAVGSVLQGESNAEIKRTKRYNKDGSFKRNKRSVWTVTTKPYKEAHFATFPMDLIEPCVLAGCPKKVCVACGTPYIKKPNFKYDKDTTKKNNTYGKYGNQETESANRQGLHADRGNKLIEIRDNLPKQSTLVGFLKSRTKAKILAESTNIPLTKIEHWFRSDEAGFAYPSIDDWKEVREFLDDWSNEFIEIDDALTNYELKTDSVISKKIIGYKLEKQCDCETNETKPGTVLDPFGGSGTTGQIADGHNRNAILCELNPEYIEISKKRLGVGTDLFSEVEIKHERK
jgi:DNA modification methylase